MHLLLSFAEGTLKVLDGHQAFFLQSQNAARGSPPVLQTIHDLSFPIVSYWYMGEQKKHCFSIMCWDWALSKLSDKLLHMYALQNVLLSSQDIQSPSHTPTGNGLLPYAWLLFTMTRWGRMFQALCKLWKFMCQKWQANHTQNAGKTETSILSKLVANRGRTIPTWDPHRPGAYTSSHILIDSFLVPLGSSKNSWLPRNLCQPYLQEGLHHFQNTFVGVELARCNGLVINLYGSFQK